MQQRKEITTKNKKVVTFISCVIHFIFSQQDQLMIHTWKDLCFAECSIKIH